MPKFTPAPWHIRGSSKQGYTQVANDAGDVIVTTLGHDHKANAKLVVMAPDLYVAIVDVLALRKHGDGGKRVAVLDAQTARQLRSLVERVR